MMSWRRLLIPTASQPSAVTLVSDRTLEASAAAILTSVNTIKTDVSQLSFTSIVQALDAINVSLQQVLVMRPATRVVFGLPTITSITGVIVMADSISFSDDAVAHVNLMWKDSIGTVTPPSDASASTSDATVASGMIENSGAGVAIKPVMGAVGSCNITVSGNAGAAMDVIAVTITVPSATSVSADTANATFTPNT